MHTSILLKRFLAAILYSSGIPLRKIQKRRVLDFVTLMYHRIIPNSLADRKCVQAGMYVTPDSFYRHIHFLKKHFEIIDLSRCSNLKKGNEARQKPYCAITFDDGWLDFYQNAYPVLKAEGIPATVFLPSSYMGTEKWFWTDRLAFLLKNKEEKFDNSSSFDPLINEIINQQGSFENQLESIIGVLKKEKMEKIDRTLDTLSELWGIKNSFPGRSFLSWDEINEMKESGLVSFGSHTVNHSILTTLTTDEIKKELEESKETLLTKGVVEPSFIPFCYPNGNHNSQIAEMVKEAGYDLAVTTKTAGMNMMLILLH